MCDWKSENTIMDDNSKYCVDVREYNPSTLKDHIGKLSREESVRKIWVPWESSQAFVEDIPQVWIQVNKVNCRKVLVNNTCHKDGITCIVLYLV